MSSERHDAIIALGKVPISEASPVGDPVRYEPEFEELQGQMDRMASLTGEQVDWRRVLELSDAILKSKSKDMLVMTYFTLAVFEEESYAGLASAFEGYTEFLTNFWEKCFPKVKPPQGRYNAVQYLPEKIVPLVELKGGPKKNPTPSEKEAVHKCAEAVVKLDEAVQKAFSEYPADQQPNLLMLTRAFKSLQEKVGPLVSAAPPAAAQPAGEGAAAADASGAPAAAAGAPAGPENFTTATQAAQSVIKVARYLLSQDIKDARGYRLMRAIHFGGLSAPPKPGLIPGPPPQRRTHFDNLAQTGNWQQLATDAEGQFAATPLWLDLQRYVALALRNLGPPYKPAYDAVVLETLALQHSMPDVFDVTFKDNKPFADGATRAWLADVAGEFGAGGGGGGGGGAADSVSKAIAEARKLLSEAKGPDAVARMAAEIEGSGSRRQRYRAQLALASFCLDLNKLQLAASILEGLERDIDAYRLEEWEPELAAHAMRDLYSCLTRLKQKPTPEEATRAGAVFARLCRLDPPAALKLDGAAPAAK